MEDHICHNASLQRSLNRNPVHTWTRRILLVGVIMVCIALLQSCYHVRFKNTSGVYEPDPTNLSEDWYRGMEVHRLDTVIKMALLNDDAMFLNNCPNGYYSIEVRVKPGDIFRNVFSLGRKRRVHVVWVCMKETN